MTEKKKLGIAPSPATLGELSQIALIGMQRRIEASQGEARDVDESEFTPQKIVANKGPTLQFDGKLLIEYSTDPKKQKVRWTELRLWETPSGAWIMESVGCSDDEAQVDIFDAEVFRGEVGERPIAVMDWLGWSYPARAIAKKMGWNLIVRVD